MKRRAFIEKGGTATLAAAALALPLKAAGKQEPMVKKFVHHVFFWMKDPGNPQHAEQFEKALRELVTIGAIESHHLGIPASTRREVIDSSYQYSLLTIFSDVAGHDAYQVHPVHDAFRVVAGELCDKVVVFDSVDLNNE
jgi:hypothetical protein